MSVAPWLLPVLWREHDWRVALERLAAQLTSVAISNPPNAAFDLGRASEYIDPDRRRAIAAYEFAAGAAAGRARELATELGWWSARARLTLAMRVHDSDPRLVLEEALAWWDAGQPDLCTLALAGLRGPGRDQLAIEVAEVAALLAGDELSDLAGESVARAMSASSTYEAADAYVMAARFCHAAGRRDDVTRWLESALAAHPTHDIAASLLLGLARRSPDPEPVQRLLQLRCANADTTRWIDVARNCAFGLIDNNHHRGFGLRLLRQALERAYESQHLDIPGHLAMWTALAAHAAADGTRRDLLPFAVDALQTCQHDVDRVWLAALAAEISLRDSNNAIVAGAYAEIIAEHAPEHPIVRELVSTVAADANASTTSPIPPEAIVAATQIEGSFDVDVDLDQVYVDATRAGQSATRLPAAPRRVPPRPPPGGARSPLPTAKPPTETPATAPTPAPARLAPAKPPPASTPKPPPTSAPKPPPASTPKPMPSVVTKPAARAKQASVAPASIARTMAATPPNPIVPVSIVTPTVIASAGTVVVGTAPAPSVTPTKALAPPKVQSVQPVMSVKPQTPQPLPKPIVTPAKAPLALSKTLPTTVGSAPKIEPVLAALRTVDRPAVPPPREEPPDAIARARRIAIPIDLRLVARGGKPVSAHSRDISTSGLFVLTAATFRGIGAQVDVELLLPGSEPFIEDEYKVKGRIVRKADDGYGVELIAPDATLLAALAAL